MHFLMCPIGTHGDVLPFVRIGSHLKRMGHRVTMLTTEPFRYVSENAGLDFECPYDDGLFDRGMNRPELWHPVRSFKVLIKDLAFKAMRPLYERIVLTTKDRDTVVVSGPLSLGARIACERWNLRGITLCLQPTVIRSVNNMPRISGLPGVDRMPRSFCSMAYRVMDMYADRIALPTIRRYRHALGITRPIDHFLTWWLSDMPVLALFPEWFAARQDDWPQNITTLGFPVDDHETPDGLDARILRFLDRGESPLLFTWGTGMRHGAANIRTVIKTCRENRWRALIIDQHTLPSDAPASGVLFCRYAPFRALLPRCRAIVHHGGIGTTAEGFRAGIPQLVIPMAFDQPDNAARVRRCGTGDVLSPHRFHRRSLVHRIKMILASESIRRQCRILSHRMSTESGAHDAAERLAALDGAR